MITSFRMYNAVPKAAEAWRALFARVFADADVPIEWITHRSPQPIADLWAQPELCCDFMCGWPFVQSGRMQPIVAPVPSPQRYEHQSRYCSEFLVRESSGWQRLEDTFGHRFGWMAADSQSGFNAPRAHLARFVSPERLSLFSDVLGPLGSPMKAIETLRANGVDVIALDSFFLDLCRHYEPARLDRIHCVATTEWTPMPLLVAAPGITASRVQRLRAHLVRVHEQRDYEALLAAVLLERFVEPDIAAYHRLDAMARFAADRGFEIIR